VVRIPQGANWIATVRDEMRGRDGRAVQLHALPADWIASAATYATLQTELRRRHIDYLSRLRRHADRVIVYASPLYVDGLVRLGFDRANLQRQLVFPIETCRLVPGIECLDAGVFANDASMYINVSHLGLRGHEAFAQWLLPYLRR
jgi:hypothetical protein